MLLYVSPLESDSYFADRENAVFWHSLAEGKKTAALRRAGQMLDEIFQWKGTPALPGQALCWPRKNVVDHDDCPVSEDSIPQTIKNGVCEQALYLVDPERVMKEKMNRSGLKNASLGSLSVSLDSSGEEYPVSSLAMNAVIGLGHLRGNIVGLGKKTSSAGRLFRG